MKKITLAALCCGVLLLAGACKGRTSENAQPNGDTVNDIVGEEVVMPAANDSDTEVIADSPAEAAATGVDQSSKTQQ